MGNILNNLPFYSNVRDSWRSFVSSREQSFIDRKRLIIFGSCSTVLLVGIVLNMLNITGATLSYFKTASAILGIIVFIAVLLYFFRKITLNTAIAIFCIFTQMELLFEIIFCALNSTPSDMGLIIGNMLLSATLLLIGIVSNLRVTPIVTSVMSFAGFVFSIHFTQSYILEFFLLIFVLVYIIIAFISKTLTSAISQLEKQNNRLEQEQSEMLNVLQLTHDQMRAYVTLSKEKRMKPELSALLFDGMDKATQQLIQENVTNYIHESEARLERLKERLPELAPSELDLCELVLKGKSVKQIAERLNYTVFYTSHQLASIKTKLGLSKREDLFEMLKERINAPL